jgi:hypothetical protein
VHAQIDIGQQERGLFKAILSKRGGQRVPYYGFVESVCYSHTLPFLWLLIVSWLRSFVGEECSLVCSFPHAAILVNRYYQQALQSSRISNATVTWSHFFISIPKNLRTTTSAAFYPLSLSNSAISPTAVVTFFPNYTSSTTMAWTCPVKLHSQHASSAWSKSWDETQFTSS